MNEDNLLIYSNNIFIQSLTKTNFLGHYEIKLCILFYLV